ncbi:hypothetical protein MNJPNG_26295 [Cupriavidus oxalaticus]|uniref:helix-turn-helix transcriptional regulator n=1 Tax=Cupriavidus oxalaticus TaxID=96344 RepID=UPI003F73156C
MTPFSTAGEPPDITTLPDDTLLRIDGVVALLRISKPTLYASTLPQSVKLGPKSQGWRVGDIRKLLQGGQ